MTYGPWSRRIFPEALDPGDLDEAWSLGWFRMRHSLFTTQFLEFEGRVYPALWLRVRLEAWAEKVVLGPLRRRSAGLTAVIEPLPDAGPGADHEDLYQRYRNSRPFEPSLSLESLLGGEPGRHVFPTWRLSLYRGPTLVAGGLFDRGNRGAAGLNSYYDPALARLSLGKRVIAEKMAWCRRQGLTDFYPGYFAPGYPRFEYKKGLGRGALDWWDPVDGRWTLLEAGQADPDPVARLCGRLVDLAQALADLGVPARIYRYGHLDINLNPDVQGLGLFDHPFFLALGPLDVEPSVLTVWEPRDGAYHALLCRSVHRFEPGAVEDGVYDQTLLRAVRVLFRSPEAEEVARVLGS